MALSPVATSHDGRPPSIGTMIKAGAGTVEASTGEIREAPITTGGTSAGSPNAKVRVVVAATVKTATETANASKNKITRAVTRNLTSGADTLKESTNQARVAVATTVKAGADTVKESTHQAGIAVATTAKAGADRVSAGKKIMQAWVHSRAQMHDIILKTHPSVAVLAMTADDDIATPEGAMLRYRARVKWCKQDRDFFVFRMVNSQDAAYQQIYNLDQKLRAAFKAREPPDGPFSWAVHDYKVCMEIQAHEMYILKQDSDVGTKPFWWKVLRGLMIITPSFNGDVLILYRAQFGPEVAFQYSCSYLHVQHLWWLCAICLVMAIMSITPKSSSEQEDDWYKWTVGMTLVWFWLALSTFQTWRQLGRLEPCPMGESDTVRADGYHSERGLASARRRCKATFCVLPAVGIFLCIYVFAFWFVTSMILAVINNWGNCIERMAREDPLICRDPAHEHPVAGTIVEISCDIFLVILLEILMPMGEFLGERLADAQNIKYQHDRDFFVSMVMAALGSFERVGFVGMLAMAFAPQWEDPWEAAAQANWTRDIDHFVDPIEDCSGYMLRQHSIACIRRKLGVSKRRYMFEKLMKGPFIVAPFVAIIVKVLLPIIVHIAVYGGRKFGAQRKFAGPCRMFWRLAALIFAYHSGNSGGLGFVVNGWPFENLEILESDQTGGEALHEMDDDDRTWADHQYVEYILGQSVRKTYEPAGELFDLKMSKLWIAFFTPIMPVGVLVTTFAQILKINFDTAKLLWARTRPLPESYNSARRSHMAFTYAVLAGTLGWYIGLQLMTYNDDLYIWKLGGNACFCLFVLWEGVTFFIASYYWE